MEGRRIGMAFYTYLLASAPHGTLYCGHTDNLTGRVSKHREKVFSGFTAKYGVFRLVWFETHGERGGAFRRERQIKKWNRAWKVRLIEASNPRWADLYEELVNWAPEGPLTGVELTLAPLVAAKTGIQAEPESQQGGVVRPQTRLGSPPSRG